MDILKWTAAALILVAVLYGGVVALGAWRWKAATRVLVARLDAAQIADGAPRYDARDIADLPAPVRRYLGRVLTDGQPMIRSLDPGLSGMFNMSLDAPQWKPFMSTQHVVANRPGFVWNGRISMFPGVPVRVHDAYVAGTGVLRPALFGLFSLGTVLGEGEVARGELMRWLAESVWQAQGALLGYRHAQAGGAAPDARPPPRDGRGRNVGPGARPGLPFDRPDRGASPYGNGSQARQCRRGARPLHAVS